MGVLKKLAVVGGALVLTEIASAGIFNSIFDPSKPKVALEGRMSFYDGEYSKKMVPGRDEVGLFVGNECIGSTSSGRLDWSHYSDLMINQNYFDKIVTGDLKIDVKAFNSQTRSVWTGKVMNYRLDNYGIDLMAYQDTHAIPLPSSALLLGAGAIALTRKSEKKT
jgi:hypothetical protein